MIVDVLNLGMQPIANAFLNKEDIDKESFYNLVATFNTETFHFSQKNIVNPSDMFTPTYAYFSSNSKPMISHFKKVSDELKLTINPKRVLEIGSNDGCFIKNFPTDTSVCVEPSNQLADITRELGYTSYNDFFGMDLIPKLEKHGKFDLIYSANCICHIPDLDNVFSTVKNILDEKGCFVFEDPSLLKMIEKNSYDQIYDEHPHIFSVIFLEKLVDKHGLRIIKVDEIDTHGGSNRIWVTHYDNHDMVHPSVSDCVGNELDFGLDKLQTFIDFGNRVNQSRLELVSILHNIKQTGKKVLSYGATSKSTTVFNYCGIDSSLIECVSDTSDTKIGKLTPGSHIPIKNIKDVNLYDYDYIFLGAWNFKDYILKNEKKWYESGGRMITHVPKVTIL